MRPLVHHRQVVIWAEQCQWVAECRLILAECHLKEEPQVIWVEQCRHLNQSVETLHYHNKLDVPGISSYNM